MLSETDKQFGHNLFGTTKQYHVDRLEELFLRYYKPLCNGRVNKYWTLHVPKPVMKKCRLHLSWVLGVNVLGVKDDKKVGKLVLKRYSNLDTLDGVSEEIRRYELIMFIYGEVDLD